MKLLIGGKNRNIHFRKDKSAFYKSNGEEHDVSKLFKKVGGLKKQYEEYLVSDNDLTERYKALSISGGSSVSRKKPVPIHKKKRKGKKFVGGMSITSLNIDIDVAPGGAVDIDTRFQVYLKLIGAYYLALLTESDSFIFGDSDNQKKAFHRNKLNNLLIINFMETTVLASRYLPYTDRINNLYFCQQLLKAAKVTVPFTDASVTQLLNLVTALIPGAPAVTGVKYNQFLNNPVGGGAPAIGPEIIEDMNAYTLPDYDPNNSIQAQFYRCIIAELIVLGGAQIHPFIQSTLLDGVILPDIDLEDNLLIDAFERNYVIVGGTVQTAIVAAAGGALAVAAAAAVADTAPASAGTELKKIPYKLFQRLILQELGENANQPDAVVATATTALETAARTPGIPVQALIDAYYNTIVIAANTAVVELPLNVTATGVAAPGAAPVAPAQHGKGLFALNIP